MTVCLGGIFFPPFIASDHFLTGFSFVTEDLDNLLTVNHFLNVAVQIGKGFLLCHKVAAAFLHNNFGKLHNEEKHYQHHYCQPDTDVQHAEEHRGYGKGGRNKLCHGLGNHLTKGIRIVGVKTHDVTVGVGVKITDGQFLHFFKHLITDGFQSALGCGYHLSVIKISG